jgi:enolase
LENGFKKIHDNFCSGNHNVFSAHLPPSIVEIGHEAFGDCGFLENVNIPSGVKRIGEHAFAYVPIKNLMLGNKIEIVSNGAFAYNNEMISAVIDATASNSLSLGSNIFSFCNYLERVYIFARPGAEISISPSAFSECSHLSDIYVSWGAEEISGAPWGGTSQVKVHYNVKEVG